METKNRNCPRNQKHGLLVSTFPVSRLHKPKTCFGNLYWRLSKGRRDFLPIFDPPSQEKTGNSLSRRTSSFYRNAPSFKSRKEGQGWGALMASSCELSRRFLPWIMFIPACFFIGFRLHISWSEGELQGLSGSRNATTERFSHEIENKKLRLKGGCQNGLPSRSVAHRIRAWSRLMEMVTHGYSPVRPRRMCREP